MTSFQLSRMICKHSWRILNKMKKVKKMSKLNITSMARLRIKTTNKGMQKDRIEEARLARQNWRSCIGEAA